MLGVVLLCVVCAMLLAMLQPHHSGMTKWDEPEAAARTIVFFI